MTVPSTTRLAILTTFILVGLLALEASAQRRGRGGRGGRGPSSWGFGGPVDLLARGDVRRELELVEDQIKQLDKLREQSRHRMREIFTDLRDKGGSRHDFGERMRAAVGQFHSEVEQAIEQILLPHQLTRLKQLELQRRLRGGLLEAFTNKQLLDQLGLTPEEQRQLEEHRREVEHELQQQFAKLRDQAREKLLGFLSPEQQSRFQVLLGAPFEFKDGRRHRGDHSPQRDSREPPR